MTGAASTDQFPTETAGLPAGVDSEVVEVSDDDLTPNPVGGQEVARGL